MSVEGETRQTTVAWRAVACYTAVAYGGMWLVSIPFWLNGNGLQVSWGGLVLTAAMWVPALAALATCRFVTHEPFLARVGLTMRLRRSQRPAPTWQAVLRYSAIAVAIFVAFAVAVALADAATGLRTDPTLGGYLDRVRASAPVGSVPDAVLLFGLGFNLVLGLLLINPLAALGEEIGWRGWLYNALLPLGTVRAVLLTGVIWGLWHAPVMLLGYNYPLLPGWVGMLLFVVPCVLLSALLGWLRSVSGSVIPAAYGHGAFNGLAGVVIFALPATGAEANGAVHGMFGAVGMALAAVAIAVVWLVRRRAR